MQLLTLLTSLALGASVLAAPTVTATKGFLIVQNKCPFDVYVWDVAEEPKGPQHLTTTNNVWSAALHTLNKGPAIKVSPSIEALGIPNYPHLTFGYTLGKANDIYYDVSSAYGVDPLFKNKKVYVHGSEGLSPPFEPIEWYGGPPSGTKRYVGDYTDVFLELCAKFP